MCEASVTGADFKGLEKRARICRMWYSKNLPTPNIALLDELKSTNTRPLKSFLEPVPLDDAAWGEMIYLKSKDAEKHNNHGFKVLNGNETSIPTITANYFKRAPDTPFIAHPTKTDLSRLINVSEHCNIRGLKGKFKKAVTNLSEGNFKGCQSNRSNHTAAHRALGNSCVPETWEAVGEWIGNWLAGQFRNVPIGSSR